MVEKRSIKFMGLTMSRVHSKKRWEKQPKITKRDSRHLKCIFSWKSNQKKLRNKPKHNHKLLQRRKDQKVTRIKLMSRMNRILYHQEIKGVLLKSRVQKQSKTKARPHLRSYKTKSKLRLVIRA